MWCLTFESSRDFIETFANQWEEDCLSISWFEAEPTGQRWQLKALFEDRPFEAILPQGVEYELFEMPEKDWLAENRKDFPPLLIGNFYIYGSHHPELPPSDKISFKIDAATAFGTGQHATTQGCLYALQDLKKEGLKVQRFLDLGCGTAILAMAAASLFQTSGWASDNDPEAVKRSELNVAENGLKDLIQVCEAEGFAETSLKTAAPFDLIIANILADPLIQLAQEMAVHTTDQGVVILSGLLQSQAAQVEKAYEQFCFRKIKEYPQDDWISLILRK